MSNKSRKNARLASKRHTATTRIQGALRKGIGKHWKKLASFKVSADLEQFEFDFKKLDPKMRNKVDTALEAAVRQLRGKYFPDRQTVSLT